MESRRDGEKEMAKAFRDWKMSISTRDWWFASYLAIVINHMANFIFVQNQFIQTPPGTSSRSGNRSYYSSCDCFSQFFPLSLFRSLSSVLQKIDISIFVAEMANNNSNVNIFFSRDSRIFFFHNKPLWRQLISNVWLSIFNGTSGEKTKHCSILLLYH